MYRAKNAVWAVLTAVILSACGSSGSSSSSTHTATSTDTGTSTMTQTGSSTNTSTSTGTSTVTSTGTGTATSTATNTGTGTATTLMGSCIVYGQYCYDFSYTFYGIPSSYTFTAITDYYYYNPTDAQGGQNTCITTRGSTVNYYQANAPATPLSTQETMRASCNATGGGYSSTFQCQQVNPNGHCTYTLSGAGNYVQQAATTTTSQWFVP